MLKQSFRPSYLTLKALKYRQVKKYRREFWVLKANSLFKLNSINSFGLSNGLNMPLNITHCKSIIYRESPSSQQRKCTVSGIVYVLLDYTICDYSVYIIFKGPPLSLQKEIKALLQKDLDPRPQTYNFHVTSATKAGPRRPDVKPTESRLQEC